MLDLSIGIDIVSIERMENILNSQKGDRFKHRIFTVPEISYCQNRANSSHHFAGRFAAKEAVKKALLASGEENIPLSGIEIIRQDNGPPEVFLHLDLKRFYHCQVSISHTDSLATAVAIVARQ